MIKKKLGMSGKEVVIEDYLVGEEISSLALVDGKNYNPLLLSQDYKKIFENDKGPNTGGMGAYSPAPLLTEALEIKIKKKINIKKLTRETRLIFLSPSWEKNTNNKNKSFVIAGGVASNKKIRKKLIDLSIEKNFNFLQSWIVESIDFWISKLLIRYPKIALGIDLLINFKEK